MYVLLDNNFSYGWKSLLFVNLKKRVEPMNLLYEDFYPMSELKLTLVVKLNRVGVSFLFSFSPDFLLKLKVRGFLSPESPDFALSSLSLPHTNSKSVSIVL